MFTCLCGNSVDREGATCERCGALHILGLDSNASYREIESTYRLMVKVWHPDRFQTDPKLREAADEKLKSINAAHAYLASLPQTKARKRPARKPAPQDVGLQATGKTQRRTFFDSALAIGILVRCVLLFIILAVSAVLLIAMDRTLSSNPATASFYAQYRSQLFFTLQTDLTAFKQRLPRFLSGTIASAPQLPEPDPASTTAQPPIVVPPPHVPMPYVTVGLTKDEVISVMGSPVSSSANALLYRDATFYFHNGAVVGWKVNPALIPLHVKLWPTGHPDPRVSTFSLGSSKNDVIAVQGTPTLLSENKLAYGSSEVFLEGGRVIGWNDNHASERLRVIAH
jgi:curved DNA-binding protein CbpA